MIANFPTERRKCPRVLVDFPLEFTHPFPREVVQVKDLSLSGICCTTEFQLPEMTRVGIILNLPEARGRFQPKEPIKCEGAVVRCEEKEAGDAGTVYDLAIFFTDIDSDSRNVLKSFIEAHLAKGAS